MSLAYPTTDTLADAPDDIPEALIDAPPEDSPAAAQLRLLVVQDHMIAAAKKVNLLADMGLTQTEGYREAYALYLAKAGEFAALRERLGL